MVTTKEWVRKSRLSSSRVGTDPGPCSPDAPRPYERTLCAPLLVYPVISRGAPRPATWETSISEGGKYGREMADPILRTACDFHDKSRDLLHAANLRHGTDGFTSPPKKGMLRNIIKKKIRQLQPGKSRLKRNCYGEFAVPQILSTTLHSMPS
jgi:hypothetical protein